MVRSKVNLISARLWMQRSMPAVIISHVQIVFDDTDFCRSHGAFISCLSEFTKMKCMIAKAKQLIAVWIQCA